MKSKRLVSIVVCVLMLVTLSLGSFASALETDAIVQNGYFVTNLSAVKATTKSISGTKTYTFYTNDHVKCWSVSITGTFSYDGSTATCTKVIQSSQVTYGNWKITTAQVSKSGNKAFGTFEAKRYTLLIPVQTVPVSLTITCDKNGNLG